MHTHTHIHIHTQTDRFTTVHTYPHTPIVALLRGQQLRAQFEHAHHFGAQLLSGLEPVRVEHNLRGVRVRVHLCAGGG